MFEITKQFRFDAAHALGEQAPDDRYRRLHGHSFRAAVALRGPRDPRHGWVIDFATLEGALAGLRGTLDHGFLNDVEGLGTPTLENLAAWIWRGLAADFPQLHLVTVYRDSCGEAASYAGPAPSATRENA